MTQETGECGPRENTRICARVSEFCSRSGSGFGFGCFVLCSGVYVFMSLVRVKFHRLLASDRIQKGTLKTEAFKVWSSYPLA